MNKKPIIWIVFTPPTGDPNNENNIHQAGILEAFDDNITVILYSFLTGDPTLTLKFKISELKNIKLFAKNQDMIEFLRARSRRLYGT
jgi:hypothetical protein